MSIEFDVLLKPINIEILPNPCTDWFIVEGSLNEYEIELYDFNNQLVSNFEGQDSRLIINTSDLVPDLYILKIRSLNNQDVCIEKNLKQ